MGIWNVYTIINIEIHAEINPLNIKHSGGLYKNMDNNVFVSSQNMVFHRIVHIFKDGFKNVFLSMRSNFSSFIDFFQIIHL